MRPAALLVALALAGCLEESAPPASSGPWSFSGTFTEGATQAEMQALGDEVRDRFGADAALLESFPVQLRVTGLETEADCGAARALAQAKPYVARVGECAQESR